MSEGISSEELDSLAFSFFKLFAQYESSLKANGYVVGSDKGVQADWDRFAKEVVGENFLEMLGNKSESATFILSNPPRKQVMKEGVVDWSEVPSTEDKSVVKLFLWIRRIRNNLFHGAKFGGVWNSPERSLNLLSNSLVVMEHFKDVDGWSTASVSAVGN